MRNVAVFAFLCGLLLLVRVMLFGVQRRDAVDQLRHRRWPLALAAFLTASGAILYARAVSGSAVTPGWAAAVVLGGSGAAAGAWWLVKRSSAIPSTDPEDDPRYRFQGHVARITHSIETKDAEPVASGRIAFSFDGKAYELIARWSPDAPGAPSFERESLGLADNEVVIERVDGDVAFVEPWTVVEERL